MRIMRDALIAVGCLALTACMKIIDLDSLRPEPTLVVNCIAIAGEPLTASVSRTWFITEYYPNVILSEADVRLFVNGTFISRMAYEDMMGEWYNSTGLFVSGYIPATGDKVRVEVREANLGEAWAETTVPRVADVLSASVAISIDSTSYSYLWKMVDYTITFRDDASTMDYYQFRMERGRPVYEADDGFTGEFWWNPLSPDYSEEPLFKQASSTLDEVLGNGWLSGYRGRVFSDELINGKEYTMRLSEERSLYGSDSGYPDSVAYKAPADRFRVLFHKISPGYYFYLKALQDQSDDSMTNTLINIGLAEPIRVYSNIEGGVGIMGACHRDTLVVEYPKVSR